MYNPRDKIHSLLCDLLLLGLKIGTRCFMVTTFLTLKNDIAEIL